MVEIDTAVTPIHRVIIFFMVRPVFIINSSFSVVLTGDTLLQRKPCLMSKRQEHIHSQRFMEDERPDVQHEPCIVRIMREEIMQVAKIGTSSRRQAVNPSGNLR